jgi:hypothetical protein
MHMHIAHTRMHTPATAPPVAREAFDQRLTGARSVTVFRSASDQPSTVACAVLEGGGRDRGESTEGSVDGGSNAGQTLRLSPLAPISSAAEEALRGEEGVSRLAGIRPVFGQSLTSLSPPQRRPCGRGGPTARRRREPARRSFSLPPPLSLFAVKGRREPARRSLSPPNSFLLTPPHFLFRGFFFFYFFDRRPNSPTPFPFPLSLPRPLIPHFLLDLSSLLCRAGQRPPPPPFLSPPDVG